jgi:hypothetical protein
MKTLRPKLRFVTERREMADSVFYDLAERPTVYAAKKANRKALSRH